jgi:hypothetical protein
VIPANGKLLIVDCVVPAGNATSLSKDMDITMLTFPGGQERTEAQFRSLLKAASFELKVHHAHNNNDQCGGRVEVPLAQMRSAISKKRGS